MELCNHCEVAFAVRERYLCSHGIATEPPLRMFEEIVFPIFRQQILLMAVTDQDASSAQCLPSPGSLLMASRLIAG